MNNTNIVNEMKERVFEANMSLPAAGLVKLTWGNVSEINRELGIIVIKPSGISYDRMTCNDMVVTDLEGSPLEEKSFNPSTDVATHAVLYKYFENVNSVVHTHSTQAVKWAQANREIPVYGTTHADTFFGSVPCTRQLTKNEVENAYELETGNVIIETFNKKSLDPLACPGVLVYGHGPFTWGETTKKAVENSIVLEEIADMATGTEQLNSVINILDSYLLEKHYYRKHGSKSYYGQNC